MNNGKIYECATNAGAYCETYLHGGDPKPPVLDNMDLIRFADLIVQECIRICDTEKADYLKWQKGALDFEEKNIYAEGGAACDTIKHKIKLMFRS